MMPMITLLGVTAAFAIELWWLRGRRCRYPSRETSRLGVNALSERRRVEARHLIRELDVDLGVEFPMQGERHFVQLEGEIGMDRCELVLHGFDEP
jgi:hypothetical protein